RAFISAGSSDRTFAGSWWQRPAPPRGGHRRLFGRTDPVVAPSKPGKLRRSVGTWLHYRAETFIIPALALLASAVCFSVFLLALGKSPAEFFSLIGRGGFGT